MLIKINPQNPDKKIIQQAAVIIKKGGLVIFPTETIYGLAADGFNRQAVKKIFAVKKRPLVKPLPLLISVKKDLKRLAKNIPLVAEILLKKFWPGPLTLVLKKKKIVPGEISAGGSTVAVRMPSDKIALALIKASETVLIGTSANVSGQAGAKTVEKISDELKEKVNLILDAGPCKIGLASTIVDLAGKNSKILREGSIKKKEIIEVVSCTNSKCKNQNIKWQCKMKK